MDNSNAVQNRRVFARFFRVFNFSIFLVKSQLAVDNRHQCNDVFARIFMSFDFLVELISNASDAIEKFRYMQVM